MIGMIRVEGSRVKECTIAAALRRLADEDPACAGLTQRAYFVMLNGEYVKQADYEQLRIKEEDVLVIVPLVAGG